MSSDIGCCHHQALIPPAFWVCRWSEIFFHLFHRHPYQLQLSQKFIVTVLVVLARARFVLYRVAWYQLYKVNYFTYIRHKWNMISPCRPPVYQHLYHLSYHLGREKSLSNVMKSIRKKGWHGFSITWSRAPGHASSVLRWDHRPPFRLFSNLPGCLPRICTSVSFPTASASLTPNYSLCHQLSTVGTVYALLGSFRPPEDTYHSAYHTVWLVSLPVFTF